MMAAAQTNPFDDLPPVDIGGANAVGGGNPFDDLPRIDLSGKSASAVSPHPGALANSSNDNYGASALKGVATAAIKGVGDIPGIVGNLKQAGDTVGDYALGAAQSLFTGRSIADEAKRNSDAAAAVQADARNKGIPVPGDYIPSGESFSNPVLAKTGEYVPESPLGRVGMAGVEAGVGGAPFGVGAAGKLGSVATSLVGGAAGQATTEATGNPVAGLVVGGAAQHGAHVGGDVAARGVSAIGDAVPPITEAQKELAARRQVGQELNTNATDPLAAQQGLSSANLEIIPGSQGTLGPASNDLGLLNYEKAVAQSPQGKPAYDARLAAQNAARQNAVAGVQPTGDVLALPETIRGNAADADTQSQAALDAARGQAAQGVAATDAATAANVAGAQQAHQSALADLQALKPNASPLETAQHFRALRDAMEADGAKQADTLGATAGQASAAAAPVANTPEQAGQGLRTPFDAKAQAAQAAVSKLYDALPKDMVAPTSEIAAKAKDIQSGQLPEHSPISGEEARLYGLAQNYSDATPLANVNALRGSILSAKAAYRQSDPQAYGRLSQLQGAVEKSVDHAQENRAALDAIAVRRGTMAASDALPARLSAVQRAESEWQNATQRPQALATGGGLSGEVAGRAESANASGNGNQGAGRGGPGNAAGDQGIQSVSRGASAGAPEQSGAGELGSTPLREANAAYREKKQTFDEGPVGEAFAKVGRGEPAFSNAELAGKVFHGRPTAGEDMRAYLKATGPEGVPAASDAAALAFRNAAMRDGVVDPKAASNWIEKHKVALGELPANVRSKFETAASAQDAVTAALAKTRDSLSSFDKTEAGKAAGLSTAGDLVKHVGSIIDSNTKPEARLAELSQKARGNPAAIDGLKRAAIEHVIEKFAPEGGEAKADRLQSYVASKRDVLSKVLSPSEIEAIGSKAAAASAAGENVKAASAQREEALKGAQKAGEAAVRGAETSRKEMLAKYDKGVLGQLKGIRGSEGDVVNSVRRVLNADNGATQMEVLAKEAAKTPEGTEALKRAVAEVVRRDVQSTSEAGASGIMQMKRAELAKFMAKRTEALKAAGLSDQQVGILRAVTEDGLQANRIVSATAAKGGSDTNQNRVAGAKLARSGGHSILGHLIVDAGLAGVGAHFGGMLGHHELGAMAGGFLGEKVLGAMREAGLDRVQKLRVEAVLHPEVGLALMKEFPNRPNQGTAAALGLRLRQLSLAGVLAAQKH